LPQYNVVVVGAGSGGLVVAAGAAGLGGRVALVERHEMGGDCLNTGCVPSKALLRAAKAAHEVRGAARFGVRPGPGDAPEDLSLVMEHVRRVRARIAPNDSVERFTSLGVEVVPGSARILSSPRGAVEVSGPGGFRLLRGRHVVLATGSRPRVPDVPGLEEAGFLTNESVWNLETLPPRLLVVGGGPIGCELGQAFARLGSKVTIASGSGHVCPREDADVAGALASGLRGEGIELLDGARPSRVRTDGAAKVVTLRLAGGDEVDRVVDAILVAAGRLPNVEGLGLEEAGVKVSRSGIETTSHGKTAAPGVWAVGDVAGGPLFTHWAGHQARVVLNNLLSPLEKAFDRDNLPWVTYTDPEVARVGLSEGEAADRGVRFSTIRVDFHEIDRAVCDGSADGSFAKALVDPKGRILGAAIVHPGAGELLAPLVLAKRHGISVSSLSETIHSYPTLSEVSRALGDRWMKTRLTPGVKAFLGKLLAWQRR
jgi:pyruvate/2-oxoglutarate dehydrogenase complex dihydrolipoamide dehydrogenase (E3) component